MSEICYFSVYELIKDLCKNLSFENKSYQQKIEADVHRLHKLKAICFDVLLKKKSLSNSKIITDPERELDVLYFSSKLRANNVHKNLIKCEEFSHLIQYVKYEKFFQLDFGKNILLFLIYLNAQTSAVENTTNEIIDHSHNLLIPGPFTLHLSYSENITYYPKPLVEKPVLQYFKGIPTLLNYKNPYLPKVLFNNHGTKFIGDVFNLKKNNKVPQSFRLCEDWNSDEVLNLTSSNIENPFSKILNGTSSKPEVSEVTSEVSIEKNEPYNLNFYNSKRIFNWNWECLGNKNGVYAEKKFATEICSSMHLKNLAEHAIGNTFTAKIVPLKEFITDLKLLTVGIQSDSFYHDEYIIFQMVDNLTIPDVLPNTLKKFVEMFLECGTCYKRLQIMIMKQNYHLMFDGFLFKALCSAVGDYLLMFRKFVLSYKDEYPIKFHQRLKKIIKQLTSLASILAVHPNVKNVKLPIGSQILGYLYKKIKVVTEDNLVMLLVFILNRCTHMYLKHLQKWIFDGILDDPNNELFICHIDDYHKNTKYYFDKAYVIRKECVPGFIRGYEEQILQCGKYTMLLKEFKPHHPIFNIEYPSMTTCFSFEEVDQLQEDFLTYNQRALEICGNTVNVKDIIQEIVDKKTAFFNKISETTRKNYENYIVEKKRKKMLETVAKQKQLIELTQQIEEHKNRKINDRLQNIEEEKQYLKEVKEREDKDIMNENLAARQRIEYYQELYDTIEKNKKVRTQQNLDNLNILSAKSSKTASTSTIESEFESCIGDEEYDSFVESNSLTLINTNIDPISNSNFSENSTDFENNNLMENLVENEYLDNENKTENDDINCNIKEESAAQKNRRKNLETNSDNYFGYETCVQLETIGNENRIERSLSEKEKIKQKILKIEYDIDVNPTKDINANPSESPNIKHEIFYKFQNDQFDKVSQKFNLKLDLNSDLRRNRRRVLESEYNIITGASFNAPMSTTSDEVYESFSETENENDREIYSVTENVNDRETYSETENENDTETFTSTTSLANLDKATTLCSDKSENKSEKNIELNRFSLQNSPIEERLKLIEAKNYPKNSLENIEAKMHILNLQKNLDPHTYKRCEQLVDSNFSCEAISPFFKIKNTGEDNKNYTSSENRNELNSLSMIAITQFLQKSILIPLSCHLEIMNKEIMKVFLKDLDLLGHFRSLRNFFLLMDGEFSSIISDGLIRKLENGCTPAELLKYQTLHSILNAAIGTTAIGSKNADNLSFIVNNIPEKFDMNSPSVLSNLSLSYRVTWPLNLILNPETLDQYGNIFKYLLKVRRISWLLEESFYILKEISNVCGNDKQGVLTSLQYRRVHQIRYKFSTFINSLKVHITSNAIESSWKTFKVDVLSATCIEDVYRKHTNYIKKVIFLCMLNRKSVEFYNAIENIFKIVIRFYRNLKSRSWQKDDLNGYTHSRYAKMLLDELEFEKCIKYVIYLGNKIVRRGYQEEIGQFIALVNFNNFYDGIDNINDNSSSSSNENFSKTGKYD